MGTQDCNVIAAVRSGKLREGGGGARPATFASYRRR
jgi:hypothetical protein